MSYPGCGIFAGYKGYISNPDLSYQRCAGVPIGDPSPADARRAVNEVKDTYASMFPNGDDTLRPLAPLIVSSASSVPSHWNLCLR